MISVVQAVRVGMLIWSFRNFILFRASYAIIKTGAFCVFMFTMMLTFCVQENDDVMAAVRIPLAYSACTQ